MTTRAWKTPRGPAPALDFERLAAMVENCAFHKWLGVKLRALDDRYEVHLDRKLERTLAMLLRLKDLRQGVIAG